MTVDKPSESEERPEKNQFKAGDNVKEYAIQEQAQNVEYNEACQAGQDFTSMASLKVPSVQERMSGYKTGATAESGKEWKCCLSHRKVGNRRSIMPLIDQEYLSQLQSAGLHVSHPIPAFCDGVWVCKPVTTPGNNLPGYTGGYITIGDADPGCPDIDAPMLGFYFHHDKWIVDGQDCAGGMGPADFIDEWSTAQEAVEDILDFYFGDPGRMNLKADRKLAHQRRRDSSQ